MTSFVVIYLHATNVCLDIYGTINGNLSKPL